jgi:CRP-like cAMP-binding protein
MAATTREFGKGQYLFREGEPSSSMFLIKKGSVAIRKTKGSGYVEVARLHQNQVIGEISFFDRLPRSASAVALNQVEVVEIDFASLDLLWKQVPDYLRAIMASVAERLRKANETIRKLRPGEGPEDDSTVLEVDPTAEESAGTAPDDPVEGQ